MAQRYRSLNGKYLEDAERLLQEGDYPQASEKVWGAVAGAIKTVAVGRRWHHSSHWDLWSVINRLQNETGDADLPRLFGIAESLHANFCEDYMSGDTLKVNAESAKMLIDKLQKVSGSTGDTDE